MTVLALIAGDAYCNPNRSPTDFGRLGYAALGIIIDVVIVISAFIFGILGATAAMSMPLGVTCALLIISGGIPLLYLISAIAIARIEKNHRAHTRV